MKSANGVHWDYFKNGQEVAGTSITVLDVIERGNTQAKTTYRVRMGCCGAQSTMTHAQIVHRAKNRAHSEQGKFRRRKLVGYCSSCRPREESKDSAEQRKQGKSRDRHVTLAFAMESLEAGCHGWAVPPSACLADGWIWADRGGR